MMLAMLHSMFDNTIWFAVLSNRSNIGEAGYGHIIQKLPLLVRSGSVPTGLGSISCRLNDRLGTLGAVVFMHKPFSGAMPPVWLPFDLQLAGPSMHTHLDCLAPLCMG